MSVSESTANNNTGIATDPAIHAGEPVIRGTATSVRAIAELWNQGMPAEEIPIHLPHLSLAQVFESLHYYLSHRGEIDRYVAANHIHEDWSGKPFNPAAQPEP